MNPQMHLLELYRITYKIRKFEQAVVELQRNGLIPKKRALLYTGQEGVAAGIGLALHKNDLMQSSHRGHGHLIAKGGDVKYMFAELMGKEQGYNKGRAGFMHMAVPKIGFLGETGIVGAGIPIAVGAALTQKIRKTGNIVVVFFGDGAANQGTFSESLNMASVWNLPILFVVENNKHALGTPQEKVTAGKGIIEKAKAFGIPAIRINGNDAEQVYLTASKIIEKIRQENKPYLIECETILLDSYEAYNSTSNEKIDPLIILKNRLIENNLIDELHNIERAIDKEIKVGIDFTLQSKYPEPILSCEG